jgi:SH3-like domain-containing protein
VDANHVNVRGQPKLNSEVVARLAKDQKVTVIEEITRKHSGPDEPSAWAKIALPSDAHVWVNASFIDANNKTVKPKKLNVRSGPGENYSVLGRLLRGEPVTQVGAKGDWLELEAPTNAYAFVAAQYLTQSAPAPVIPAEPPPASAAVANEPAIAAAPAEAPATTATAPVITPSVPPQPVAVGTPETTSSLVSDEPLPKRIVEREGIVRGTGSIQAPTHFQLVSPENKQLIDYLYTTSPSLDLSRYKGLRIIVTGEEGLEERWGNTPVITIQKIQVVE